MTRGTKGLSLGVSLTTLDQAQRVETIEMLGGSPVRALELLETPFRGDAARIAETRRALSTVGTECVTVHSEFGAEVDISSLT